MAHTGVIESKFQFVILAAKRARQLYGGAEPLITAAGKKAVRIAQEEVAAGLVDYEILGDGSAGSAKGPMNAGRKPVKKRKSEALTARLAS